MGYSFLLILNILREAKFTQSYENGLAMLSNFKGEEKPQSPFTIFLSSGNIFSRDPHDLDVM